MSVEGWNTKYLGDVAHIVMGQSPDSKYYSNEHIGLPFLQGCAEFSHKFPRANLYCSQGKKVAPSGSILFSVRAPVGKTNLADTDYIIGRGVAAFSASEISQDYLHHYLVYSENNFRNASQGSTFEAINSKELNSWPINIPESLEKQERIAEVLSTVDRAIAQTEALIAKQQRLKTGLMQDLLTKGIDENGNIRSEETHEFKDSAIGRIPVEWEIITVNDISTKITDGDHHTPSRSSEGYFLLSARNILNGSLELSNVDYVSETEYQRMIKRCYPEAGDIFVSCSGTIGRVCQVPDLLKCVLVRSAALIKLNRSEMQSRFAEWILRSDLVQTQIQIGQQQAAQPNLFQSEIANLSFAKPSLIEQINISNILDEQESRIKKENLFLDKLNKIKTGLMQDLLTGKVRVTSLLDNSGGTDP